MRSWRVILCVSSSCIRHPANSQHVCVQPEHFSQPLASLFTCKNHVTGIDRKVGGGTENRLQSFTSPKESDKTARSLFLSGARLFPKSSHARLQATEHLSIFPGVWLNAWKVRLSLHLAHTFYLTAACTLTLLSLLRPPGTSCSRQAVQWGVTPERELKGREIKTKIVSLCFSFLWMEVNPQYLVLSWLHSVPNRGFYPYPDFLLLLAMES